MGSLKLKINLVNRQQLFYKKFLYKVQVEAKGALLLNKQIKSYNLLVDKYKGMENCLWKKWKICNIPFKSIDKNIITSLINFIQKHKHNSECMLRFENHMCMYTNSYDLVKELINIYEHSIVEKVHNIPPEGILYFSKEPTHKYRVYCKNTRIPVEEFERFTEILHTNDDLFPSENLKRRIERRFNVSHRYIDGSDFINYNNESIITYVGLMFGEILGKKYKLEKRPD
jgi:hypothetical protein